MRVKILCPDGVHYVRASGNGLIDARAKTASTWEIFEMEEFADGRFALRTLPAHTLPMQYVRAHRGGGGILIADRLVAGNHEKFTQLILGGDCVAICSHEKNYWRAKSLGGAEVDCVPTVPSTWEVFKIEAAFADD